MSASVWLPKKTVDNIVQQIPGVDGSPLIKASDENEYSVGNMTNTASNILIRDVLPIAYGGFIPQSLAISVEDQGRSFFFHSFVTADPKGPMNYAVYLPQLYNDVLAQGAIANPLPGIITAIGMAGVSNLQNSPTAMVATRKEHTKVLRTLNAALQDPRAAITDSTLMSVLLLGLFEVKFP